MKAILALLFVAPVLSACAGGLLAVAPAESIVAREAGYDSYFEQGLDFVAEQICDDPTRDPVTGDCT